MSNNSAFRVRSKRLYQKIIFLVCIFFLQITACKDKQFFELERPVESPWSNIVEFERGPIGGYSRLFSPDNDWNNVYNYWYLYKNAVGDDVAWSTPGDATWGWYRDTENNKDWVDKTFEAAYIVISSVNDAFKFVDDKNGSPFPNISPEDQQYNQNRILGELHFLRGFSYYMVATLCCNAYVPGGDNDAKQIALRTSKPSTYEDATSSKIGTVQEVWDQILSDFTMAYEILPERYIAGKMHTSYQAGRANKFAAAAMLCRSYFAMGNYTKAAEYASQIIDQNGGDYTMSEEPIDAFNKSTLGCGKETIMYIPCFDQTYGKQNLTASTFNDLYLDSHCLWTAIHMDYATLKRIGWMMDAKNDTSITITARRDKRFTQLFAIREAADIPAERQIAGRYYENRVNLKWRTIVANKYYRGPGIGYTNVPQIRLAEIYLTRSICWFKTGNKSAAANDLNIVRKRAWDANVAGQSYESSASYVTDNNITEQMIGDERLIEMFCEGDRIDYLRGLKVNVANGERGSGSVPYTDKGFVWPVPITESSLNNGYN